MRDDRKKKGIGTVRQDTVRGATNITKETAVAIANDLACVFTYTNKVRVGLDKSREAIDSMSCKNQRDAAHADKLHCASVYLCEVEKYIRGRICELKGWTGDEWNERVKQGFLGYRELEDLTDNDLIWEEGVLKEGVLEI